MIDELRGERIDLIPWSSEPEKFIAAALSPGKVLSIVLQKDANKTAQVTVSNDMVALTLGRNGQNVRLASKLTGWNIEVQSEAQKKEETAKNVENLQKNLADIEGVGPKTAEVLIKGGWSTAEKIALAQVDQLTALQGIGEKTAEKIIESAREVVEKKNSNNKEREEVSESEKEGTPGESSKT